MYSFQSLNIIIKWVFFFFIYIYIILFQFTVGMSQIQNEILLKK